MRKYLFSIVLALFVVLGAKAQNDTVIFSAKGGFYEESFALQLHHALTQNQIRYTTNGSRPTAQSPLYTEPLVLDAGLYSKSDIYTIVNCPEQEFFLPDSVRHCIVIRAAVFDENDNCVSQVMTNSYFISALGCDTHGLPAVSVCADSLDLFDYERGIFVPGIYFDTLYPYFTGNYFMRGLEWERVCNFEYYELNNTGINQQVGLRTHGKKARYQGQKGMKIYAREEYGKKRFKHKFFENIPLDDFKHLCLKPYMSAWNGSGSKDYIMSRIAQHVNVESPSSRACVLFLNGEYWGMYYVAEKPDERFLEDHLDINIDSVNMINIWNDLECGSGDNFYALRTWMEQADLSDEEQYSYVKTQIDIPNFIDYYVLELFSANLDWPAYNTRMWQIGDGKWRWIFYDGDACLEALSFDVFANATYDGDEGYPSSRRATLFFRKLLENEEFREQFARRFNELASTTFAYRNTKPYFDYIKQTLQDEVPNQIERFSCPQTYSEWESYCMPVIDYFLSERPEKIIEELSAFLSVDEPVMVAVGCYPNPFRDEIHLQWLLVDGKAHEVAIYDVLGRKVFSETLVADKTDGINIHPNLPAGVYVLKVGTYAQRMVKY